MEISRKESDQWRYERRIRQAVDSSEEAMKLLQISSNKPWFSKGNLSRREYWRELHRTLPLEYKTERIPMKKQNVEKTIPNDPFGVQIVKQKNAEIQKKLKKQMKLLSQRKKEPLRRPIRIVSKPTVEKSGTRAFYKYIDAELEAYHEKCHEASSQIDELENQLQKYRVTRKSGDIERQHDEWVANRQWEIILEEVIQEESTSVIEELLDELDEGKELPEEEESLVEEALYDGSMQEVLCEKFNVQVTRSLLQCLLPGTWLNDEIINFWFQMLGERDIELDRALKSHFFNSFFFTKVSEGGYNFVNVRRWTRKIDIFAMDKVFVPVNIRNVHWCLAVIFIQEKRIQYFDSMNGAGTECLNVLLKYLHDEMKHKKNQPFDVSEWTLLSTTQETPQQGNSHDCGVFTCMFADYLSRDEPLSFSQRHMKYFRKRMVLRMIQGSIPVDEDLDL